MPNAVLEQLPVAAIETDPNQPRKHFDQEKMDELKQSIASQGLLQPITVKRIPGGYMLIAGERRFRSVTALGWATVPALVLDVTDIEATKLQLLENLVRADLNPIEEARHIKKLLDGNMPIKEIAEACGLSVNQVRWRTEVLRARPDILHLVERSEMTPSMAWYIGRLSLNNQAKVLWEMTRRDMGFDLVKALTDQLLMQEQQGDMFPETKDSQQDMAIRRAVRSALDRAIAALNEVIAVEERASGSVAGAMAAELPTTLAKLSELKRNLGRVERALISEQAKMLAMAGQDAG